MREKELSQTVFFLNTKSLVAFEHSKKTSVMQRGNGGGGATLGRDDIVHPRCRAFGQWSVLETRKGGQVEILRRPSVKWSLYNSTLSSTVLP